MIYVAKEILTSWTIYLCTTIYFHSPDVCTLLFTVSVQCTLYLHDICILYMSRKKPSHPGPLNDLLCPRFRCSAWILPVHDGRTGLRPDQSCPRRALRLCRQGADQGHQGGVPSQGRVHPGRVSGHQKAEKLVQEADPGLPPFHYAGQDHHSACSMWKVEFNFRAICNFRLKRSFKKIHPINRFIFVFIQFPLLIAPL